MRAHPSATENLQTPLEAFIQKCKTALFGVLFIVNKEEEGSHWIWSALEVLIDHAQDLSFFFNFKGFPWQHEVRWFVFMLEIFSPEKFVSSSRALYFFLLAILGLVLMNVAWVGYSFSTNNFRLIWTLKFLRYTLGLFATVLYMPILERFIHSIIRCDEKSMMDEEIMEGGWVECWKGDRLVGSVLGTIVVIIFVALVLAVGATYFDFDPNPKNIESRPHSRIETLYNACRTIVIVLSVVLETYGDVHSALNKWLYAGICVATSGILAFSFVWYIPYYSFKFSLFRAALQLNLFWAALCSIFTIIRPHSDIGIIFIILSPIAMLLGCFLVRARRRAVEDMDARDKVEGADTLTVELMVRFRLEKSGLLYREPSKNLTLLSASPGDLRAETISASPGETDHSTLTHILNIYNTALRVHPESVLLHLFASQFYLLRLGNKSQCVALIAKAERLDPQLDEASMVFRRQRLLNERFSGGDMIDFIAYEQGIRGAKKWERRAESAIIQFWAELLHPQPSFQHLHTHGAAITTAISSAQQHYTQVLKLSPSSPHVYRLYAGFLMNVLNDRKQGMELVERADELEAGDRNNNVEEEGALESAATKSPGAWAEGALVTISGEAGELGKIINANPSWLKIFGYKKQDIIGQNISCIVPTPFAEVHDELLQRYLDTGYAKVIDRPREVLGLHANGHLMLVTLLVKQLTSPIGQISFLGVMSKVPNKPGQEFMVLDTKFGILHSTEGLAHLFGGFVKGMEVAMWITGLDGPSIAKAGRSGVKVAGNGWEVVVVGDKVGVIGEECWICRVKVAENTKYVTGRTTPKTASEAGLVETGGSCPFGYGKGGEDGGGGGDGAGTGNLEFTPDVVSGSANSLASSTEAMPLSFSPSASQNNVRPPETLQLRRRSRANIKEAESDPDVEDDDDADSDERRSVGSSSSASTRNTSSYIKNILTLKNVQTNRHLRYLRISILSCLLILVALSAAQNVYYKSLHNDFISNVQTVHKRAEVCLAIMDAVEGIRTVEIGGGVGGLDIGWADVVEAKGRLNNDVQVLISGVEELSSLVPGSVPYAEITVYAPTETTSSLLDALQDTISNIRYILDTLSDAGGIKVARDVIYINGPTGILEGVNASTVDAVQFFEQRIQSVESQQIGRSVVGPAVCILVFLIGVWPLYARIQGSRQRFFQMFLDIPKEVVKGIYSSHMQRISEGADSDDEDFESLDAGNRFALEKMIQDEALHGPGSPTTTTDIESLLPSARHGSHHHLHRSLKFQSRFQAISDFIHRFHDPHRLFPKATLIFMLCAAYFFSAGGVTHQFLTSKSRISSNVYWAMQIPILTKQVVWRVREEMLKGYGYEDDGSDATWRNGGGKNVSNLLKELGWVERGLMYGDGQMGTSSPIEERAKGLNELMIGDACVDGVPEDCGQFQNGVLQNGLHAGITRYIQLNRDVLSLLPATPEPMTTTPVIPATATTRMTAVRAMSLRYLPPPMMLSAQLRMDDIQRHIDWFERFHLAFTVVFCTFLALLYAFLFRPLLIALSEDNRRTHVMLYMIPPEILSKVESIRTWAGIKRRDDRRNSHRFTDKGKGSTEVEVKHLDDKVARTVEIV